MKDLLDKKTKRVNPVAGVVAGLVIGAGAAVAGVVALKDEKNRKKVKDAFKTVKGQAKEYLDDLQKTARQEEKKIVKLADQKKKEVKITKTIKKSIAPKLAKGVKKTKRKAS
jgi:hypothetical protein